MCNYFYAIDIFPRCWRSFSGVVSKSQEYQAVIDKSFKSGICFLKVCPIFVGTTLCQFTKYSNFLEAHSLFSCAAAVVTLSSCLGFIHFPGFMPPLSLGGLGAHCALNGVLRGHFLGIKMLQ